MHNRITAAAWRANVDMQIIIDRSAAINYMVKYVTKGEKAGNRLSELYNSVILHSDETDNPTKKLRSLMLKSVANKRDIGQFEVKDYCNQNLCTAAHLNLSPSP